MFLNIKGLKNLGENVKFLFPYLILIQQFLTSLFHFLSSVCAKYKETVNLIVKRKQKISITRTLAFVRNMYLWFLRLFESLFTISKPTTTFSTNNKIRQPNGNEIIFKWEEFNFWQITYYQYQKPVLILHYIFVCLYVLCMLFFCKA